MLFEGRLIRLVSCALIILGAVCLLISSGSGTAVLTLEDLPPTTNVTIGTTPALTTAAIVTTLAVVEASPYVLNVSDALLTQSPPLEFSDSSYISLEGLGEKWENSDGVTIAFWYKSGAISPKGTIFTYCSPDRDGGSIVVYNNVNLQLLVSGSLYPTGLFLADDYWNHIALRFTSASQSWGIYLNGVEVVTGVLRGVVLPRGGGSMLVGQQRQCSSHAVLMFDSDRGLVGLLSAFSVWLSLEKESVSSLYRPCAFCPTASLPQPLLLLGSRQGSPSSPIDISSHFVANNFSVSAVSLQRPLASLPYRSFAEGSWAGSLRVALFDLRGGGAVTVCFWVRALPNQLTPGSILKYWNPVDASVMMEIRDLGNLAVSIGDAHAVLGAYVQDGGWHHIGVAWESERGSLSLYIDGVLIRRRNQFSVGTLLVNNLTLDIAQSSFEIARLSVSNTFLQKGDIISVMHSRTTQQTPGLLLALGFIGYFIFDFSAAANKIMIIGPGSPGVFNRQTLSEGSLRFRRNGAGYLRTLLTFPTPHLDEISFALWIRTNRTGESTLVTYGFSQEIFSIEMKFDEINIPHFCIQGDCSPLPGSLPATNEWYHFALTWSSSSGDVALLINGNRAGPSTKIGKGKHIKPGGMLVVAQKETVSPSGQISTDISSGNSNSFIGDIARVTLWGMVPTTDTLLDHMMLSQLPSLPPLSPSSLSPLLALSISVSQSKLLNLAGRDVEIGGGPDAPTVEPFTLGPIDNMRITLLRRKGAISYDDSGLGFVRVDPFTAVSQKNISISIWVRCSPTATGTILSYSSNGDTMFSLYDPKSLKFSMANVIAEFGLDLTVLSGWRLVSVSWTSNSLGLTHLSLDASILKVAHMGEGIEISPGGCLLVGSVQRHIGASFVVDISKSLRAAQLSGLTIWSSFLTTDKILQLIDFQPLLPEPSLVLGLFEEVSRAIVLDVSGNFSNVVIKGALPQVVLRTL